MATIKVLLHVYLVLVLPTSCIDADKRLVADTNHCQPLQAPGHSTIVCGAGFPFYSCTASCDAGYQFPSGMTSDKRDCDQMFGEWFDPPGKNISDCIPVCKPDCQNGGKCILPNTCNCPGGFMGKQCQHPVSNCAPPHEPSNGTLTCHHDTSGTRCTVACNKGFKPARTISSSYNCSPDGTWSPPKSEIPRCVSAVCKPNCQNGGKCILPNTCTCPGGFMGKQCQHPVSNCAPPHEPSNGTLTCHHDTSGTRCTVACNKGFKPARTISSSYNCSPDGTWSPPKSEIPRCVSDYNLCRPLPAPGHGTIACGLGFPFYSCKASCDAGYQFPSGMTSEKRDCDTMFGEWFDPPGKNISDCIRRQCQPLPAPGHGTIVCGAGFPFYSCTASCDAGYQFPSGMTSDKRECDQMFGEWFDPPGKNISDCIPRHCQPLPAPGHGTIVCGAGFPFYSCKASCDAGYQFPSGMTSDKRECDQMFGEWFDPPGKNISDCIPVCKPNCQNGGKCSLPNTCTCPGGFMGKQCQDREPIHNIGKRYLLGIVYQWGPWASFTTCTDCVNGSKQRQRYCYDDNKQHVQGSYCKGYAIEFRPCLPADCDSCVDTYNPGAPCPVTYCTDYADWSKTYCKMTCGHCSTPAPVINGNWGSWSQYSVCSRLCGKGSRSRYRSCNNPPPSGGGHGCYGNSNEATSCNIAPCSIDGRWSNWNTWSSCSVSCGLGVITRDRMCNNPAPVGNGAPCNGNSKEMHECTVGPCAEWSHWFNGDCSVSCGNGTMERLRHCSTGRESDCNGIAYEMVPCSNVECI